MSDSPKPNREDLKTLTIKDSVAEHPRLSFLAVFMVPKTAKAYV
jgi:hypothetical protein